MGFPRTLTRSRVHSVSLTINMCTHLQSAASWKQICWFSTGELSSKKSTQMIFLINGMSITAGVLAKQEPLHRGCCGSTLWMFLKQEAKTQKHSKWVSEKLSEQTPDSKTILNESAAETASHFVTYMFHWSGSWSPRRIILPVRSPREGLLSSSFFSPFFLFPFFFLCFPVFSRAESFQTPNQKIQNAPRTRKSLQSLERERESDAERERERGGESEGWARFPDPDCPAEEREDV